MQFRKDINGLRALAVISVVLFHFNASWMSGGFAGVDVFFVISGFLMTGIIFRGIEKNNFSILRFYVARANRIIPALAVLCLVLLVFGWFYLTPLDYKVLGEHVGSSMGFLSNFVYWKESGYFDAVSREKWLLHTWSLSVEWQFYILYPIILVALHKFMSVKTMKLAVLLGTVFGFIYCVVATYKWPESSYYLLPTRAWEMMLGGVAYLYPFKLNEKRNKFLEWAGLALVTASYFFISKENAWPGYLALIPVMGAFFIIQAQRTNSAITGNVVFQNLGQWSYSIYLWHWPLVVAIYYFSLDEKWIYIGILLSVLLGYLSNKYIENIKFKSDFNKAFDYFKHKPFYIAWSIILLCSSILHFDGSNNNSFLSEYKKMAYPRYCHVDGSNKHLQDQYINCKVGNENKQPIALIWGDSYAGVLDPFVDSLLVDSSAVSRTTSHCFPSLSLNSMLGGIPEYCNRIRKESIVELKENKYDIIFLAGRWESTYEQHGEVGLKSIFDTVDFASKYSKIVYIFEQPVSYKRNMSNQFMRHHISNLISKTVPRDDDKAIDINNKIKEIYKQKNYENVYLVSREVLYGSKSPSDYTEQGFPYTHDTGHLSTAGSLAAADNFKRSPLYKPFSEVINTSVVLKQASNRVAD